MKTKTPRYVVAALLVGCCSLVSCGTQHGEAGRTGAPAPRASVTDRSCALEEVPEDTTDDDGELPDTTSDDQELPDTTSDDQGSAGGDTTSDDQELPDTTSDDQGVPAGDTTDDDGAGVPAAGPHRWFPMTREFRAHLKASARKADAAVAAHVEKVCIRTPGGDGRTEADVWVDYGVWEDDELQRAAEVFARWRQSVYGDHGHVTVLAPAKMDAERSW
ncbi:hypothetical protein JK359_19800 [Streptomyces actinomycinicus]|uniref:Lipoprotein n=1 Tax=Streptomyces actinomycinicus TaxID=1695166 RepID=A0A937EKQ1_9ACTN|nr:hypothetical protein [Streptomyces actinomycinicus]MBL1084182.1 hypothetical protein [Streptomyces actinomycinicus]